MAKPTKAKIKLQIPAGQATPAPPVGPALGAHGVNLGGFVSQFNEATKSMIGDIVPVEITIYEDRSFSMVFKSPPTSALIKKAAGVEKGSGAVPKKVGKITKAQILDIIERKKDDLNASNADEAVEMIKGTARSMGIEVVD